MQNKHCGEEQLLAMPLSPPMGSGHNPKEGYASACYICRLKVLETSGGKFTDVKTDMLTKFETSPLGVRVILRSGVTEFLSGELVGFVDYNY